MDKEFIIEKIKKGEKDPNRIIAWLNCLPAVTSRKPAKVKSGDVFMHPIFKHPYVILEIKGSSFVCGLMTSEPLCTEILEECQSRFFTGRFFTKVIFTVESPEDHTFLNVFENSKQLKSIRKTLKEIFS